MNSHHQHIPKETGTQKHTSSLMTWNYAGIRWRKKTKNMFLSRFLSKSVFLNLKTVCKLPLLCLRVPQRKKRASRFRQARMAVLPCICIENSLWIIFPREGVNKPYRHLPGEKLNSSSCVLQKTFLGKTACSPISTRLSPQCSWTARLPSQNTTGLQGPQLPGP